jgi:hypothetical protein
MILGQRSQKYIEENYTHRGLLLGVVPIYLQLRVVATDEWDNTYYEVNEREDGFPCMEERNGVPRFMFYIACAMLGAWMMSASSVGWQVPVPILIGSDLIQEEE